jgi:hypothetical protein
LLADREYSENIDQSIRENEFIDDYSTIVRSLARELH